MGEEGNRVAPNSVTLLAVLSACGHSGLVEQGQECFALFQEKYGVDPGPEHDACFIDILALLNACTLSQAVTRGGFAAKQLFE
ncbi:Pentatricopeptide repeat-containing protein [Camellia lanceoleosa]|uniref:Pentatricopeptide repeat-containing protein n=1 Tax=Camellia lanceoleosa TaxID=1840588 RepID=A0ACC0HRA6_9ERIC|nr:Pentatricopeptide repeat-containing protein [Camellia lanceoleosa]